MLRVYLLLQSLALAILLTWPAPVVLSEQALGSLDGDAIKHVWNLWWMHQEAWDGVAGLRTTWAGFPDGMDLYPIEPLNGLFAAVIPIGPVALSNVLAIANLTLLGVCAGWLGELVSLRARGAFVAAALAECSAFAGFTLHVGVGELRELWWLPLGFGCLLEAQRTQATRWFVALGATLVGAVLSCFYIGFFLALGVLVYALVTLRRNTRLLVRYAVTAVVAGALALAPFRLFARTYDPDDDRYVQSFERWKQTRPMETYRGAAVEPSQLVTWRSLDRGQTARQAGAYEGGRYLGWVTLGLALAGAWAQPRRGGPWLVVAGVGVLFSLGTVLWEHGAIVQAPWGGRLVLPLAWLNAYLGYYEEPINFPARFLALAAVAALPAAASSVGRWKWCWVPVVVACVDMVAHDLVPWPRATMALPNASALHADGGALGVLNITPFIRLRDPDPSRLLANKDSEGRSMAIAAQIAMGRRFDIVPIERIDYWAPDGLLWALPLPLLTAVNARGPAPTVDAYRRDLWLLRDRGFDKLLLTFGGGRKTVADTDAFFTALCGPPEAADVALVWTVPEVPATEDEGAAWHAEQAARVAALAAPRMGAQFPGGAAVVPPPPGAAGARSPVSGTMEVP